MTRAITAVGFSALTMLAAGTALGQAAQTTVTPPAQSEASSGGAGPATAGKASAALLLGYGIKDPNPYKLGVGVRGGFTLPMGVYVGGTFVYHLGTSESVGQYTSSVNVMYVGAEGGYDIAAGPVIVRPGLGLGLAIWKSSSPYCVFNAITGGVNCSEQSSSETRLSLWPGAMVAYPINNKFLVGGDLRYVIITGEGGGDASAFSMFLTGGMIF